MIHFNPSMYEAAVEQSVRSKFQIAILCFGFGYLTCIFLIHLISLVQLKCQY
jgi:hypothetical protein